MKLNYFLIFGMVVLLIAGILIFVCEEKSKRILIKENSLLKNETQLYKIILIADNEFSESSLNSQKADALYSEAGYFYEEHNYKSLEISCKNARDYYAEESQNYKAIKSKLLSYQIEDKLIRIFVDSLDSLIEITDSMYEACEHFESSARYYQKYYYDEGTNADYEMGGFEIESMNEKIKAHDNAVGEYNQLIEDFKIELSGRLE